MKKTVFFLFVVLAFALSAQNLDPVEYAGQSCTSIMVGKKASRDGSVMTSHTCDGRYRTWVNIVPASDHPAGSTTTIYKGRLHTSFPEDTTGLKVVGTIPEEAHTYAYLNTAYPCMNEHQLAMGESTFGGPDTLCNPNNMFLIEELQRIALQRCTTARAAIRLIGELVARYGYADGGECLTIADPKEVWQMEIIGAGRDVKGGVWAAQRVPDDHVAVSCNIPRIGRLQRENTDYFMCSDNVEAVAKKYNLWDGKDDLVFWKAFNASYANGKNYRERDYFILSTLAPSLKLDRAGEDLPFSVKPDQKVDVRDVMDLLRSTFEGTDMDMCRNLKVEKKGDSIVSPIANPWMGGDMRNLLNTIAPNKVEFQRTVSVAWCSYSHVIQLRGWMDDDLGGVCWLSVDNPAQSPRIPIFAGATQLPSAFNLCGQKHYDERAILWQFRKANKLATVAWQAVRGMFNKVLNEQEDKAFDGMRRIEAEVRIQHRQGKPTAETTRMLNGYTAEVYNSHLYAWNQLEQKLWMRFGMGF